MKGEKRKRFGFGKNWKNYLTFINKDKISLSKKAICNFLKKDNLSGKTFLDIGSGSGLSSLSALELGAKVTSFDYDADSVECTEQLREKFSRKSANWKVSQGSVLNKELISQLGQFDIVYSWGVLHHTGDMNTALENVLVPLKENGLLYIAIYNDQGWLSDYWLIIKKIYNSNFIFKTILILIYTPYFVIGRFLINSLRKKKIERGMNLWHDMLDWLGGYPFEVASTEKIISFYKNKGLSLINLNDCGRKMGCNEFLFEYKS
jgi:2-polyprenyl-6-hydroxyphenyl methylase/3-demethylubiquinone-9 3-methyltransferase